MVDGSGRGESGGRSGGDIELFDLGTAPVEGGLEGKVLLHQPGVTVEEQDVTVPNLHMGSRDPRGVAAETPAASGPAPELSVASASLPGLKIHLTPAAEALVLPTGEKSVSLDLSGIAEKAGGEAVTFVDLPAGVRLSAGTVGPEGAVTVAAQDLPGLQVVIDPGRVPGAIILSAVVVAPVEGEAAVVADTDPILLEESVATVEIDNAASDVALAVQSASGSEDGAIALDIRAALSDTDGSESLSVIVSGLPTGAILSAGTDNGDGTWTLAGEQLTGLSVTPPPDFSGSFDLAVTATATESLGGATASTTASLTVNVAGDADVPTLAAVDATGTEDQAIALDISAALGDASESLSLTIAGVPDGASLSAGTDNGDGTWTLTPGQLSGLAITPAADYSGSFDLTVTATSADGSDTASTTASLTVNVAGDADSVSLSLQNAAASLGQSGQGQTLAGTGGGDTLRGTWDSDTISGGAGGDSLHGDSGAVGATTVHLDLAAALGDLDGSEALSVSISGLPSGASLSAGTDNGDGTWSLASSQLSGLTVTTPAGFSSNFRLEISATASEGDGDSSTTTGSLDVSFSAAGGNDVLIGGTGDDYMYGNAGDDTFVYRQGDGTDRFYGGAGTDTVDAGTAQTIGTDYYAADATVERIVGGGSTTLVGTAGGNTLD
ncbi:MAG: Ig-like domain-containing protein, partial [Magnetospirillum sp. WYHS-4]